MDTFKSNFSTLGYAEITDCLNFVEKKINLVSIAPFHYERKAKKRLLNCFEDKGEKFPKYRYVGQSRSTHVVVIVFPVSFIDVVTI